LERRDSLERRTVTGDNMMMLLMMMIIIIIIIIIISPKIYTVSLYVMKEKERRCL